jgi:hypothetical protein
MGAYPLRDWLSDYAWLCQESHKHGPHSASMGIEAFEAHFFETRKDPALANHCMERFVAAVSYLDQNISAIDSGKAAVVGKDRILVSKRVIITLYRFFVGRPDHDIDFPIPIDVFLREVKIDMDA